MEATEGVQKVMGFSRGWHHWNSIRLGIRRSEKDSYCSLYLYTYVKGKRNEQLICTSEIGKTVNVQLEFKHHAFIGRVFNEFGKYLKVEYAPIYFPIGYQLNSYFETDAPENKVKHFDVEVWDVKYH